MKFNKARKFDLPVEGKSDGDTELVHALSAWIVIKKRLAVVSFRDLPLLMITV